MSDLQSWKTSYETCTKEMESAIAMLYGPQWTAIISFQGAADQYIAELEQRVKDLETILKVVNEPVGRDVTAELGHVRGLDMLQYLDSAWRHDKQEHVYLAFIGRRYYTPADLETLQRLAERGYVTIDADTRTCWIREAGMNYLATLKSEVFGK